MHRLGILWAGLLLCVVMTRPAWAVVGDITITMGDLPTQSVDGLVHPTGVQFGFTVGGVPNTDARYASGGPGSTTFVQDPSIEGTTAGVLAIIFPSPTPIVRFGVARLTGETIANGAAVQLFNAANVSLGITNLPMTAMPTFAEAQFAYSGTAVKRMTVDFTVSPVSTSPRFAFDNLVFRVPEPRSAAMLMLGWLAMVVRRRNTSFVSKGD
jgi:hypothetical protein